MQKVVIKTAIITLCIVLLLLGIASCALLIFAPKTVGDFLSDIGNESGALKQYERVYNQESTQENLILVINSTLRAEDGDKLIVYFDEYEKKDFDFEQDYLSFVAGKYCVALVKANQADKALTAAEKYSSDYQSGNPMQALIVYGLDSENNQFLNLVLQRLTAFKQENYNNLADGAKAVLDEDIARLTSYLG